MSFPPGAGRGTNPPWVPLPMRTIDASLRRTVCHCPSCSTRPSSVPRFCAGGRCALEHLRSSGRCRSTAGAFAPDRKPPSVRSAEQESDDFLAEPPSKPAARLADIVTAGQNELQFSKPFQLPRRLMWSGTRRCSQRRRVPLLCFLLPPWLSASENFPSLLDIAFRPEPHLYGCGPATRTDTIIQPNRMPFIYGLRIHLSLPAPQPSMPSRLMRSLC